jgi:crotonobetainyl-CoA:carnitine CoA-transferase CaiB-like acyl-CoA transferase
VIAAVNARDRTGQGQEILTSLMAQSLLFQIGEVTTYPGRPANDLGGLDCIGLRALHRYYACADGWIGLVCERAEEAAALGRVLGLGLSADALTAPRDGEIAKALEVAFLTRPRGATLDALLDAGVAAAPVLRGAEALEDPWLAENNFLQPWRHPRLGPVIGIRSFFDFSRTPAGYSRPTPDLGEHSREILADFGVADGRIAALFAAGAVFEPGPVLTTVE